MQTIPPRDRVLTWALPLLPAMVALLLLALGIQAANRIVGNELARRSGFRVEQAAQLYADQVSSLISRRAAEIQLLGEMSRAEMRSDIWRAQMQRLKASASAYVWIGVTDNAGEVQVATDGLLEGASIAQRGVFVNGRLGPWFGSLHAPVALVEPLQRSGKAVPAELADIAMPIVDAQGALKGVIASHLDARDFADLREHVLGPQGARRHLTLALVDGEGRVLLGERPGVTEDVWRALLASPASTPVSRLDGDGEPHYLSRSVIQPGNPPLRTGWQVVASQPLSVALAPVAQLERSLVSWGTVITLLLGLAGFAVSRRLARPYSESELRLREQGEVLSAVINSASDAVISVDAAGRISLFNPAAARIFGHPAERMVGQPLDVLLPVDERGHHLGYLQRFAESQVTTRPMGVGRVAGLHANGEVLDLEASISQITVRGHKLLTAILRDVTERVRAERALASYQTELSELTQRLLHQEKQTTRKLAQTLHDQLGQTLGAIRLSFDALCGLMPPDMPPGARERERKLGDQIDVANAEVRRALVALRPPLLDEAGLPAALDSEIQARAPAAEPTRLRLEVAPSARDLRWPADVEYAAFMVAREALANAMLHAHATEVVVGVEGAPGYLHLRVADNGAGLDKAMAAGRPGHLGMVGMRERALAIGARVEAQGSPGAGTVISLTWEAAAAGDISH